MEEKVGVLPAPLGSGVVGGRSLGPQTLALAPEGGCPRLDARGQIGPNDLLPLPKGKNSRKKPKDNKESTESHFHPQIHPQQIGKQQKKSKTTKTS